MSKIKNFLLNGEKYFTTEEITCNQKNWNSVYINNNDKIEIVTIVGGG